MQVTSTGQGFSMAECSAASFKRLIEEVKPYFHLYPFEERLEARFR